MNRIAAAAALLAVGVCAAGAGPLAPPRPEPPRKVLAQPQAPVPAAPKVRSLDRKGLTRALDRARAGRPLSMTVHDLTTGTVFRYRPGARFVTASCAKVDMVMALLLRRQKEGEGLDAAERELAGPAIRYSDNRAADRLWERAGGAEGVGSANRRFGLRETETVGGRCLDLYCWGITDTTADDQVRLLKALVRDDGPLDRAGREYVLGLMAQVVPEQRWGVSAAARPGEPVALKNGWQRRLAHGKLWAVNSVGRVRTGGHDLLIAVLSDHHPDTGAGIALVERAARLAGEEFRRTTAPPEPQ
ncbi:serine hydrolase [Actinomadura craniellae]|uniref:Serine hydrolase n=1 Tax=Actinomadura craniellae TaxID=2231787 RepID=A0A365H2Q9_9ACTN|nr:serine hydrolase [Actinomadura craniellae]RAY13306.1 serine hydrolase [Actinomadura craniellae]